MAATLIIADGLVTETVNRKFSVTDNGAFLRSDHPLTLRDACLLEQSTEHVIVWNQMTDSV
jgi:hypothetical protein